MEATAIATMNFVKPHFIEELGCDGLTSQEIADSIGMQKINLHTLAQNLIQDGDLTQVLESNTLRNSNGCPIKLYLFNVDDAKFIVTQSSTKAGRAYCRYLIECEKAVETIASLSPELRYLIKLETQQKEQQKQLEQMQSTLAQTGATLEDATLTSAQIQELENLFSQLRRVTGDHKTVSRTKGALKAQFLSCAKTGLTYKDIAAKHFTACKAMVQAQIDSMAS
jgi:hypothetical protein